MKKLSYILFLVVIFTGCEKEKELYYERPEWLQGPLYEQIKSTGEYSEFINLVEYMGYDKFLSSRLTFTLFLPTNEAFQDYYLEMGVGSFTDLDTSFLKELVDYHLMENSWDSVKLVNKTSWSYWGSIPQNFRSASYYAPPIVMESGKNVVYENTFLHIYSTPMFQWYGLDENDYLSFFPGSSFSGFNVDRASILESQIGAENGFYYVIDKVLPPRTTADTRIKSHPEFSVFYNLLNIFQKFDYNSSASAKNTGYDSLYSMSYSLNMDLADEKITDSAPDGYYHVLGTVFVPLNQVIIDYFNENFPAYGGIENVPNIIIKYFLEAHLILNKKLFPSVLAREINEVNDFSDEIDFESGNGIVSYDMSSNAMIYGVDRVINTNAFSTVSGPIIKNPEYRIFTMMLELSGEIKTFFKREIGHVAFVLHDNLLREMGFNYYEGDPVDFTDDRIFLNNDILTTTEIKDFLQDYISITYKDLDSSEEVYIKSKSGNYLKVTNDNVEGIFGEANIRNFYSAINGSVLEVDTVLEQTIAYTIEDYLNDNKGLYSEFFSLCDNAGMLDDEGNITKLSLFNGVTVFLPGNEAIQAIKGTYIPEGANSSNFDFKGLVQYQIISERAIFTDDDFPVSDYGTDLFIAGERMKLTARAGNNQINLVDKLGNSITIIPGPGSNIITTNGIIHITDKVALY